MILIAGAQASVDISRWPLLAREVYVQKSNSPILYKYNSIDQLQFEMRLRSNIIEAAQGLNRSGAKFATFKTTYCNERIWHRTPEGGIKLRQGVTPAAGIRDIFVNGRMYGFECATGILIVLYKGILDSIKESEFNRLFANLLLYDWQYDSDLRMIQVQGIEHSYLGDVLYFRNPDVNPATPEFQGENVIKCGEDLFFGHGMGILPSHMIIGMLNRLRRPFAMQSAYLTDQVDYPDYIYLSQFASGGTRSDSPYVHAQIGGRRFIKYN